MRRVDQHILRLQVRRLDDCFRRRPVGDDDFIVRRVVRFYRIGVFVAVRIVDGAAYDDVVAVIADLLADIGGDGVAVPADDLMGQVLQVNRLEGRRTRIGMVAQDVRRHRIGAGNGVNIYGMLEGIGKGEIQRIIGYGRIHADGHVRRRGKMGRPAGDEQAGPQDGVEQSRADLADAALQACPSLK